MSDYTPEQQRERRAERKARMEERLKREPLPPMKTGGRPPANKADRIDDDGLDEIFESNDTPIEPLKKVRSKSPGGYRTRGKQALSIVGDVNQRALERIAKDFKKHPLKLTPLEVLIDIAADVSASKASRQAAAAAAAPYLHKKMTSFNDDQVATTAGNAPPVIHIVEVTNQDQTTRAELEKELDDAINNAGKSRTE